MKNNKKGEDSLFESLNCAQEMVALFLCSMSSLQVTVTTGDLGKMSSIWCHCGQVEKPQTSPSV